MTGLLSWAVPGSPLLVGLADPVDAAAEPVLVPGRLELDADRRPVVVFLPPGGRLPEHADAGRLGEDWAAVHVTDCGEGWALRVFAPGSPGHLGWQLGQTRRRLRQLLATDRLDDELVTEIGKRGLDGAALLKSAKELIEKAQNP